jgi:hypothetical protein
VFLLAWLRFGIGAVAMLRWLKKPADENRSPRSRAGWSSSNPSSAISSSRSA